MKMVSRRRGVSLLAMAMAGVLAVGSVAWACVVNLDLNKFRVNPAPGVSAPYGTGDTMIATGNVLEKANWRYYIKLRAGTYSSATTLDRRNCGDMGTVQTVAVTNASHSFSHSFRLMTGGQAGQSGTPVPVGPAYFCALPGLQAETSTPTFPVTMVMGGTTFYVDKDFSARNGNITFI